MNQSVLVKRVRISDMILKVLIYLAASILLACVLVFIMSHATRYFDQAFHRYDDLNESVQENVSAIRVVKAYVREKFEGEKFRKASEALEVEVVDTWQADAVRDTRTLSGGESFLVSLALALALSDLVSHKTRIDSLFLDEGFGTLDSETLDTALDALDALNASGKTIGVISHVEAMKERIPVQIKVKKINGLGYSKLESTFAVK